MSSWEIWLILWAGYQDEYSDVTWSENSPSFQSVMCYSENSPQWLWRSVAISFKSCCASFWCKASEGSREGMRASAAGIHPTKGRTGEAFLSSTYSQINAVPKHVWVYESTIPTAKVACIFSQHGYVRVVLWGLLFPVSQHSLERCADHFIMLAVLLLACSSLPWLSASDSYTWMCPALTALYWEQMQFEKLCWTVHLIFLPLPFLCVSWK